MGDTFKINDIEYEFDFILSNPDNQKITFSKTAIKVMTISDSLFDPFISADVTITNPYDLIEDQYLIRGDGRDEFYIMFKPKDPPQGSINGDVFKRTFVVIGESNNVNPKVRSENLKTFALIDKNAIPFSDNIPYGKKYSGKVGEILQKLFIELLGEDKVDINNWAMGDFDIDYIPPATFRYVDLLHYLMRLYYAKDEDTYVRGIINFDNGTQKFRLDLISTIFKNNHDYLLEAFSLGDLTDVIDTSNPNNPYGETPTGEFTSGLRNFGLSTPLYGYNNDYFVNSLVFGYDQILGEHKIKKITFDEIKGKWTKKFVDVFKSLGVKPKPFAVKNNSTKKKFKRYRFPYPVEDGVKIVEAELNNALTFYNLQGTFSNIGSSQREAGNFVDVYSTRRVDDSPDNNILKADEKLLGRWFITEVRHNFIANLYSNEILATKTYIGDSKIKEDA